MSRSRTLATLASLLALSGAAAATVVLRLDLSELVSRADLVVEGECVAARPVLDRGGLVATEVSFLVRRGFKGASDAGSTVVFRVPGGELGERGLVIAGMPTFRPGESLVLFLSAETWRGVRLPIGLGQGKLEVRRDAASGAKKLARSMGDAVLVDASGRAVAEPAGQPFDYDPFVAEVERLVAASRRK